MKKIFTYIVHWDSLELRIAPGTEKAVTSNYMKMKLILSPSLQSHPLSHSSAKTSLLVI